MTNANERYARGLARFQELHPQAATAMQAALGEVAPDLMRMVLEFPFGDIYERGNLDLRQRQLVTISALATRGDAASQLAIHIGIGLRAGLSQAEIVEALIQLVPYAGFPTAINAIQVAKGVFDQTATDAS